MSRETVRFRFGARTYPPGKKEDSEIGTSVKRPCSCQCTQPSAVVADTPVELTPPVVYLERLFDETLGNPPNRHPMFSFKSQNGEMGEPE